MIGETLPCKYGLNHKMKPCNRLGTIDRSLSYPFNELRNYRGGFGKIATGALVLVFDKIGAGHL